MSTVAIVNPKSANGKAAEVWNKVRAHLPGPVKTLETKAPGHGIQLTAEAIKSGAQIVIAVGGDGTINEVVNGFFEAEHLISRDASLAIIPHGTGSDFRRVLNLPFDDKKAAAVIYSGTPRMLDLMKVQYTAQDGMRALRYSINITSFGMGGAVAARANRSSKAFGGRISFLVATLQTALAFAGNSITLTLDGSKTIDAKVTNVVVGNGQYHGGGMWVCPGASIDDGVMEVTLIRNLTLFELIKSLPALYNGHIYGHPKVESYRAKQVQADSEDLALIEIDGEPLGRLPIEISVLPGAIRVLLP